MKNTRDTSLTYFMCSLWVANAKAFYTRGKENYVKVIYYSEEN